MTLPNIQPEKYNQLLTEKVDKVKRDFSNFELPTLEVFESAKTHYRLRAEFRVWHDGDDLDYVMFKPGDNKTPLKLSRCEMVSTRIHDMMFDFLNTIKQNDTLRFKLFEVDFLSTLSGQLLISMLYHRPIDEEWEVEAEKLRQQYGVDLIGRSRKKKIVLGRDHVIETLNINEREYHYMQIENGFTQPNGEVCQKMIEWALDVSKNAGGDLVEFYCGNGNFTLPLAQNFNRVVATEIAKTSVNAARFNIEQNEIDNIDILRMPSEDLTLVLQGKKETRKVANLDLESCHFSTVLVDPPRSGLDEDTVQQVSEYDNIIYISCNPETLHANLKEITKTHTIERFTVFDQFPYTHHLECGVFLSKKANSPV